MTNPITNPTLLSDIDYKKIERYRKTRIKRNQHYRDIQEQKDAGTYVNPRKQYENDDGSLRTDIEIPGWLRALHSAWKANAGERAYNKGAKPEKLEEMRISHKIKLFHLPKKKKPKRSDKMKTLLLEHGVGVRDDRTLIDERYDNHEGWIFCPNGRMKFEDKDTISAYAFIKNNV